VLPTDPARFPPIRCGEQGDVGDQGAQQAFRSLLLVLGSDHSRGRSAVIVRVRAGLAGADNAFVVDVHRPHHKNAITP
jgi:hypothetical protein